MGQTKAQIKNDIDNRHAHLQSNLRELAGKVKSVTDWRHHVQERPWTMVAIAFGAGALLAALSGWGGRSRTGHLDPSNSARNQALGASDQVLHTWDTIKNALVGVAGSKLKKFLASAVPGFSEQLAQAEEESKVPQTGNGSSH